MTPWFDFIFNNCIEEEVLFVYHFLPPIRNSRKQKQLRQVQFNIMESVRFLVGSIFIMRSQSAHMTTIYERQPQCVPRATRNATHDDL